jgi:hypothetical protein
MLALIILCGGQDIVKITPGQTQSPAAGLRGDIASYLEFLQAERVELDFQVKRGEIDRAFYFRALQRLNILRSLVISYGRSGNLDRLPEFLVVPADEINSLIPDGRNRLKQTKPGQIIDGHWRFLKTVSTNETFYVLEHLDSSAPGINP